MSQRIEWVDQLRAASVFAVIWLHVAAEVVVSNPSTTSIDWWVGNVADAAVRWCVPVFVMISGMFLIPSASKDNLSSFYSHRLERIVIPTLCWTTFYLVLSVFQKEEFNLYEIGIRFLLGAPYFHLWFLYMLLGLYLAAPFLSTFSLNASSKKQCVAIAIAFLLASCNHISNVYRGVQFDIFTNWISFVPYFLAGYTISQGNFLNISIGLCYFYTVASIFGIAVLTGLLLSSLGSKAWEMMYGYLNPLVILLSLSVFIIFYQLPNQPLKPFSLYTNFIARFSLGIYAIHPFWILVLAKLGIHTTKFSGIIGIIMCSTTVFLTSLLSCWLISLTGIGKRIVI